ncbi:MAG: hypothetical protein P1U37_19260 [Minwuia sp.]|nr:hypothetical protein [Minwuia sp.]
MARNPSTPAISDMFRLATFNIGLARLHLLGQTLREGVPHQAERLPAICAFLDRNSEQVDAWLLQEAYGRDVVARLARCAGFRVIAARDSGPDTGLVMLIRKDLRITQPAVLQFPAVDWVERFIARKGLQFVDIEVAHKRFRVGNMHTSYDGRGRQKIAAVAPGMRRRQIGMALDAMAEASADRTLVLGGDFNAAAAFEPETFRLGASHGWKDARADAHEWDGSGVTSWSNANPIINGDSPDQDIDHVWVRPADPGLVLRSRHIATRHTVPLPDGQMIPLSDHYGLAVGIDTALP